MNPTREEALFAGALPKSPAERAAWLKAECPGDPALRKRLEALLAAHEQADGVLASGLEETGPTQELGFVERLADDSVGQMISRYKVLEKVGEGGCGIVYVAEQLEPIRRRVALKVIKAGMDSKAVIARFEAERQALAMMDHPNIARVLDAGTTEGGRPYFVMELVRGFKITDYCDRNAVPTKDRLQLFIQVCHAIQHAHHKGVIHRDVKPSNILVTLHDGVPVPKVIDFGIAKATEGRLTEATVYTQLHQFIGTPAYMSPEQAEMSGLDVDTRSDVYSLGVVLYELLTGRTPFDWKEWAAKGVDALRKAIRELEPVRPSTRLATLRGEELTRTAKRRSSDVPRLISLLRGDLDWIVMKCLEKDRTRRYETANGLGADLERYLRHEPVLARPPSASYRARKFVRRNKAMAIATTAVVAALLLGSTEVTRQWRRAEAEQRKSQQLLYAANMNLLAEAWERNNSMRVRQLLEETADFSDHGFEWFYWQRRFHQEIQTLHGHSSLVMSASFSPDGRRIATGSLDGTAKLWDAATGNEVFTMRGHLAGIRSTAFSMDGKWIVTGGDDETVRIWDAENGRELRTLPNRSGTVWSVVWSPDSRRVLVGAEDHTVRIWDAATGRRLLTLTGHSNRVWSAVYSQDGRQIVSGSGDGVMKLWEAATGRELWSVKAHSDQLNSVAFSPNGQRIVSGANDQTVKVWEAGSGKELLTLQHPLLAPWSVEFSPHGDRIASGGSDGVNVWEASTGRVLFTFKGHAAMVRSVRFSPDGQRMLTGSDDGTARIWDVANAEDAFVRRGHSGTIRSLTFSPDGRRILTGSDDGTARIWETTRGTELLAFKGHGDAIRSAAFSPDGRIILTASQDHTVKLWDLATGKEIRTLGEHHDAVGCAAFDGSGRQIVTAGWDGVVRLWATRSGQEMAAFRAHQHRISSAAFSHNGRQVITGSGDRNAKVWKAADGRELLTLVGHDAAVTSLAISLDGRWIVTGSADNTARLWDAARGRQMQILRGHSDPVTSVAFSPDGQRVVTGSEDGTARLWKTVGGNELLLLGRHSTGVTAVAFSPDGLRLAVGSRDGTVRVWLAATKAQVLAWRENDSIMAEQVARRRVNERLSSERDWASRLQDPGTIREWLVLAPIHIHTVDNLLAVDQQQVPD